MNTNKSTKSKKVSKKVQKTSGQLVYPDGYVRPSKTASEMLSAADIRKRMKNFEKVETTDINNLVDGDKVRYFEVLEDGNFKYKPGGFILVNRAPDYLVLTNNGFNWSVQLNNNIIFKAKDIDIIEEAHGVEIAKLKKNIVELRTYALKQKNIIEKLTKMLKNDE